MSQRTSRHPVLFLAGCRLFRLFLLVSFFLASTTSSSLAQSWILHLDADPHESDVWVEYRVDGGSWTRYYGNELPTDVLIPAWATAAIKADSGSAFNFDHWLLNGSTLGGNYVEWTMEGNVDATAYFQSAGSYILHLDADPHHSELCVEYRVDGGSWTRYYGNELPTDVLIPVGATAAIKAPCDDPIPFDHWLFNGSTLGGNYVEWTMDGNVEATAYFGFMLEDEYEENDTHANAYDLTGNESTWLSTIDGLGVQCDEDWYRIEVSPAGHEHVSIDANFTHDNGDIGLELYDSSEVLLDGSYTTTDDEHIDYIVAGAGFYYVRLFHGDQCNFYDLWWEVPEPGATSLAISALATVCGLSVWARRRRAG